MKTLNELKKELLADGVIDASEVKELEKALYADGVIDTEEANFLFELNDAVSGKANDASWKDFFVKAVASYVLDDPKTPGVIDEDEAKWLCSKIQGDGQIDKCEKALLLYLKKHANEFPQSLDKLL